MSNLIQISFIVFPIRLKNYINTSVLWQLLSRSENTHIAEIYSKCKHNEHKLCISLMVLLLKLLSLQVSSAHCYTTLLLRVRLSTSEKTITHHTTCIWGSENCCMRKWQLCPRNRMFWSTRIFISPFITISQSQKWPQGNQNTEMYFI